MIFLIFIYIFIGDVYTKTCEIIPVIGNKRIYISKSKIKVAEKKDIKNSSNFIFDKTNVEKNKYILKNGKNYIMAKKNKITLTKNKSDAAVFESERIKSGYNIKTGDLCLTSSAEDKLKLLKCENDGKFRVYEQLYNFKEGDEDDESSEKNENKKKSEKVKKKSEFEENEKMDSDATISEDHNGEDGFSESSDKYKSNGDSEGKSGESEECQLYNNQNNQRSMPQNNNIMGLVLHQRDIIKKLFKKVKLQKSHNSYNKKMNENKPESSSENIESENENSSSNSECENITPTVFPTRPPYQRPRPININPYQKNFNRGNPNNRNNQYPNNRYFNKNYPNYEGKIPMQNRNDPFHPINHNKNFNNTNYINKAENSGNNDLFNDYNNNQQGIDNPFSFKQSNIFEYVFNQ